MNLSQMSWFLNGGINSSKVGNHYKPHTQNGLVLQWWNKASPLKFELHHAYKVFDEMPQVFVVIFLMKNSSIVAFCNVGFLLMSQSTKLFSLGRIKGMRHSSKEMWRPLELNEAVKTKACKNHSFPLLKAKWHATMSFTDGFDLIRFLIITRRGPHLPFAPRTHALSLESSLATV
ncbi:LOW QUALITY PROTEIN: hypothetical protein Cgig2_017278 [Carnegiea gigantea]|uniref:Uncharacterized protein n=1 Tax=Carnegiea gigantea TaxID=171969 RepID=A0A9Q1KID2_9CARY|nr:LOW QUALITY PROTEIN: hypothetical protein Cgig2_017278 [Carnegiea gigantea]